MIVHPAVRGSAFPGLVVLAATLFGIAGCATQETPDTSEPRPAQSAKAADSEVSDAPESAEKVRTTLPTSCSQLLPAEVLARYEPRIEMFDQTDTADARLVNLIGPKTLAAVESGEQRMYCNFGIRQTDGGADIAVAVISESSKLELLEALRSSIFEEIDPRQAEAAFQRNESEDHQQKAVTVIDGDVLITLASRLGPDYAWEALASVRSK